MRLKTIKLAGFKSFVEPTAIPISGNLIGIVGPNGCGKSNIIDAIRWVMGEMSAKNLRGDSMADVIFNGSNTRKPAALASVELVFDNAEGRLGGPYASYNEISVRREAGRDGQSDYFLNKTRCRRKDITDLFLGTGLGPRAYSIIEQGMVTRIVEAKPEDLRGFIEEAAGISRYKERRKETENRIKHTRENLARVEDIRGELGSQLEKLQRQSRAAARYKELKQEERDVRAQLLALRWQELNAKLQEQDLVLAQHQTTLDAALAQQRAIEAEIEKLRAQQTEANERFNAVQGEYYAAGAEISRLEQSIEHARETHARLVSEQEQVNRTWDEASAHLNADRSRFEDLRAALESLAPRVAELTQARDAAVAARADTERAMQSWQVEWEAFTHQAAEESKQREVQGTRIQSLESQLAQAGEREARLQAEYADIQAQLEASGVEALRAEAARLDEACAAQEGRLAEIETGIREARAAREAAAARLETLRAQAQSIEARLAGLRELQVAAEGEAHDDARLLDWLRRHRLDEAPRLAGKLGVEPGWERAVEHVLGADLTALCVDGFDALANDAVEFNGSAVTLLDQSVSSPRAGSNRPRLLDRIKTDLDLTPWLADVYVAGSLADALARRGELAPHESFITREGAWVGRNWLSLGAEQGARAGMLERSREIRELEAQAGDIQRDLAALQTQLTETVERLHALEQNRDETGRELNERHRERAQSREKLGHQEASLARLTARRAQIETERAEIAAQVERNRAGLDEARALLRAAEAGGLNHDDRRAQLQQARDQRARALDEARSHEHRTREEMHRLEVEQQGVQTAFDATRASIERLEAQLSQLAARREELAQLLAGARPEEGLQAKLNEFLATRLEVETRLGAARQAVADVDNQLREQEQARGREERRAGEIRNQIEGERVVRQELVVRRDTHADQLREAGADLDKTVKGLPAEASEPAWAERLEQIAARIERLGPINLVAIEEYDEASKRKEYLDKQHEDLTQALATLEDAIRKIDGETRTRFKETFDKVNENFRSFFPQLFGGGSAYLELTDNDLLETGVAVMARPPGKRNSTIHLLSGGEKALTAVAMIFAIFELNPAPFCLLDEVDAPLDDANVVRYGETLKNLSGRTQLVYITHNKMSMEIADILIGVTMSEPGVSRLVAVDVDEALQMVAQ
jgi:chromosome segregation protein